MSRVGTQILGQQTQPITQPTDRGKEWVKQAAVVIAASLFVALCARVTVPLPFTPVPLTLQNFGVLTVGLLLGSRRSCALSHRRRVRNASIQPRNPRQRDYPSIRADWWLPHCLSTRGLRCRLDIRTEIGKKLTTFRLGRAVLRGGGTGALCRRTQLACRAHAFHFSGSEVWPLLVCFCGSHQGADVRWRCRSLAPTAFCAGVSADFVSRLSCRDGAISVSLRGRRRGKPRLYGKESDFTNTDFCRTGLRNLMSTVSSPVREITVAHSPDSDDAFMFYGLATNKVRVPGLKFSHTLCDIETLNRQAQDGVYDVTAISFHAFPYIQENYSLMSCGGSVGEGYGPMLVSTRPFTQDEIKQRKIAVPGKLTTAYLALELFAPGIQVEVVPFDQIIPQILEGKHEAGLIIHEGQLTYDKSGLHRVVDLGRWWQKVTGLPLPLGGNVIRRSLGPETMASVTQALRESIQYAIDHREEALAYAMQFARELDTQLTDKFVGMYVNERTLDYGDDGREAVRRLLDMGHKAGIIPQPPRVEWV